MIKAKYWMSEKIGLMSLSIESHIGDMVRGFVRVHCLKARGADVTKLNRPPTQKTSSSKATESNTAGVNIHRYPIIGMLLNWC